MASTDQALQCTVWILGSGVWTSSTNGGGICLNHSLNGVSLVTLITCLVEWVQPSSLASKEKMSWYSAKRDQAASASWSGQDSNPLRSNFSNSLSCLCFAVSFGIWWPWALLNASIMLVHMVTLAAMWPLTLPSSILLYECYIKAGSMCLETCYYDRYLMWLVLLLLCGHKGDGSFYENVFMLLTMMK